MKFTAYARVTIGVEFEVEAESEDAVYDDESIVLQCYVGNGSISGLLGIVGDSVRSSSVCWCTADCYPEIEGVEVVEDSDR